MWKIIFVLGVIFVSGCMGRDANPISRYNPGDDKRSCTSLKVEIAENEVQITKKLKKDESKFLSNAFWLYATLGLAMDVKEAEKIEAEALQDRNRALKIIMAEKGCINK